ncbi:hypothetical protein, partial [Streptomyces sp. NPDC058861]|uniref:hypothetical protein n=1 Tax=Streptomyces sp. NPDC058861 TaxID=3346653 RepID=UPI00367FB630
TPGTTPAARPSSGAGAGRGRGPYTVGPAAAAWGAAPPRLVRDHQIPHDRVWIMPLGDDSAAWTAAGRNIVGQVMDLGFNFSGRLHLTLGVR